MLHQSLIELAETAPQCTQVAQARGVLAESLDLLRNAIAHNSNSIECMQWLSQVVTDVLHSPAVQELVGPCQIIVSGGFGRGDGIPTFGAKWLTVLPDGVEDQDSFGKLSALLLAMDFAAEDLGPAFTPATRTVWEDRIRAAASSGNAVQMGTFADAGSWCYPFLIEVTPDWSPMLRYAIAHRPATVQADHGLPRKDQTVQIRKDLLLPIGYLARWAGAAAGSTATTTLARIDAAVHAGVLTEIEADALHDAWIAAATLQLERWYEGLAGKPTTVEAMTQLQRATFGAAARLTADVSRSLEARFL